MKLKYFYSVLVATSCMNSGLNVLAQPHTPKTTVKVASVSLNQTVYDYARNVKNITDAIDQAVADKADVLALPELCLTGYAADDYHQWNKNNERVWRQLQYIASYAKSKNPNLIISIGTPWHYADKTLKASDPLYNINSRPYNVQVLMTQGKVVAMSAKSILADGPAEYEPRQFNPWPIEKGTILIKMPDGSKIPFGKPLVAFGEKEKYISIYQEQCAEGWPGIHDDLTIIYKEQNEARRLIEISKTSDVSLALNASASRPQPALNKEKIRSQGLAMEGSRYAGAYVYTNYLGSESAVYAGEGSQIYAQNGKVIHHGQRYSFKDVSYSSAVLNIPFAQKGLPELKVLHQFTLHKLGTYTGKSAEFEKAPSNELAYEEFIRSIALWLRDYLAKQPWPAQGFLISLSGGADSGYGAVALATMIELSIQEEGVEGFLKRFPKLSCKDEALKALKEKDEEEAIAIIKKHMLTFIYLPTDNSSDVTLNAARLLIEGGSLSNGEKVKGIGGTFTVHNVQKVWDEYLLTHASFDMKNAIIDMEKEADLGWKDNFFRWAIKIVSQFSGSEDLYSKWMEIQIRQKIKEYVNATREEEAILPEYIKKHCIRPLPTWAKSQDNLTLQNYQARTRLIVPWAIANQEGKIPLVTSNASEAALGYTTAGGDMHMGGANPIGGIPKSIIKESLAYFQKHGVVGLKPIAALEGITVQTPTAELKKIAEGETPQTDEGDLGFSYTQSEKMERAIITKRQTPNEVFKIFKKSSDFPTEDEALRNILQQFCVRRWPAAQFKRVMGTIAPYVGENFDPHASVRTTILGDHFNTDIAILTFELMRQKIGSQDNFVKIFHISFEDAKGIVERDEFLKSILLSTQSPVLTFKSIQELENSQFTQILRNKAAELKHIMKS